MRAFWLRLIRDEDGSYETLVDPPDRAETSGVTRKDGVRPGVPGDEYTAIAQAVTHDSLQIKAYLEGRFLLQRVVLYKCQYDSKSINE